MAHPRSYVAAFQRAELLRMQIDSQIRDIRSKRRIHQNMIEKLAQLRIELTNLEREQQTDGMNPAYGHRIARVHDMIRDYNHHIRIQNDILRNIWTHQSTATNRH